MIKGLLRLTITLNIVLSISLSLYSIPPEIIVKFANYPNPFDSRVENTSIIYYLEEDSKINIKIYDLFGYLVKEFTFTKGYFGAQKGWNKILWEGENELGSKVSKGGYICCLIFESNSGSGSISHKIGVVH